MFWERLVWAKNETLLTSCRICEPRKESDSCQPSSSLVNACMCSTGENDMKRSCRELMRPSPLRQWTAVTRLLRGARIVTDPKTLAYLNAEVEKRIREEQADFKRNDTQTTK
jgi:hypothetical protein